MSSLGFKHAAVPRRAPGRALTAEHSYGLLLAAPLALLAAVLLIELPQAYNVDSWLALVAGRSVWQTGLPHHDTLTVLSHGARWIDQQWLSQLASYGLARLGGLGLLGLVNVALLVGGVAGAVLAARRRGASPASVLVALPLCLVMIVPSREVRTQTFVVPLFVALVQLLSRDARAPSARVFWCLPILVLWANLHGSATLGGGLVILYAVTAIWGRRSELAGNRALWIRPLALAAGSAAALLATPYGLSIVGYYRTTLFSSTLRHVVTEWRPITSSPLTAAAVLVVGGLALWSFARRPGRTTTWEKLAFLVLAVGAVSAVRNALFLGLFALCALPVCLPFAGARRSGEGSARRLLANATVAGAAGAVLAIAAASTLTRPDVHFESAHGAPGALAAVTRATHIAPDAHIMSDWRYADWLLWRDPALAGRLAYDVRYELLEPGQLSGITALLAHSGAQWRRAARGYRVIVLSQPSDHRAAAAFAQEPGARVLGRSGGELVVLRSAREALR